MTLKDAVKLVQPYDFRAVSGKDCSEYAEDFIAYAGCGELYTAEVKHGPNIHLLCFGIRECYIYHTVALLPGDIIVDLTNRGSEVMTLEHFKDYITRHTIGETPSFHKGEYKLGGIDLFR